MSEETKKAPAIRFQGFTDDWEQRKLGEVFFQTSKYVNPKESNLELWSLTVENGLTPKTERYNREFLVKKEDQFKSVDHNEFIYNPMNMTLGAVDLNLTGKTVAVSGYYITMLSKDGFDSKYFSIWLKSPLAIKMYKLYATGSLIERQRVQFPTLSQIKSSVPQIEEQTKIGSFFKQLDDTIALHQRKLTLLKQLKQTYLQALFPQSELNIPTLRFARFSDSWEQRKVSSLAKETYGGGTPRTGVKKYWNGSAPWIQSSDLSINQLHNVQPTKYITEEAIKQSATHNVPGNSIAIVTRVGVGKLALMRSSYSTSQDFLSLSNLNVDAVFGVYCLYKMLQREVNNIQGTSIKGITKADLLEKCVSVPTKVEEQVKIGAFFKKIDDTIDFHESKLKHILELKKAFLEKMFL